MALGCCHELNCKRTTPIQLYIGDLTGEIYVVTRYTVRTDHGNGRATFKADERHDITETFRLFIRDNRETIEAMLCE